LKKYFWDYAFLLGIAGFIVVIDQWSKYLVRTQIPFAGSWSPFVWLEPYVRIVHWQNTGAAFGMLQGFGLIFAILAVVVSIAILYYFPRVPRNEWAMRLAMAMQLGGAVGNLIDRITVGTVTDFISVGKFAVFNVADACISVGTVILVLAVWDSERRQKKLIQAYPEQAHASTEPPDPPKPVEQTPDSENHPLE
jgi:signal peptidase II